MAILDNRVRIKPKSYNLQKLWYIFITLSLLGAVFATVNNQNTKQVILEVDGRLARITQPISDFTNYAIRLGTNIFRISWLHEENVRLVSEVTTLRSMQDSLNTSLEVALANNRALQNELNLIERTVQTNMRARILYTTNREYEQNALLELGSQDGIRQDQIAMSFHGLVGRVIDVSKNFARLMLLTDPQSRIPVQTIDGKFRGVAVGDGKALRVIHFSRDNLPQVGEILITSGDGKLYPYGIAVARISTVCPNFISALSFFDSDNTEFVTLLK